MFCTGTLPSSLQSGQRHGIDTSQQLDIACGFPACQGPDRSVSRRPSPTVAFSADCHYIRPPLGQAACCAVACPRQRNSRRQRVSPKPKSHGALTGAPGVAAASTKEVTAAVRSFYSPDRRRSSGRRSAHLALQRKESAPRNRGGPVWRSPLLNPALGTAIRRVNIHVLPVAYVPSPLCRASCAVHRRSAAAPDPHDESSRQDKSADADTRALQFTGGLSLFCRTLPRGQASTGETSRVHPTRACMILPWRRYSVRSINRSLALGRGSGNQAPNVMPSRKLRRCLAGA